MKIKTEVNSGNLALSSMRRRGQPHGVGGGAAYAGPLNVVTWPTPAQCAAAFAAGCVFAAALDATAVAVACGLTAWGW